MSVKIKSFKNKDDSIKAVELNEKLIKEVEEHRKTLKQLEERLKFEELISRLSAGFLNLPLNQIDYEINNALRDITELLGLGRSYIYEIIEEENTFKLTYGYNSPGVKPMPSYVNENHFPWVATQIYSGNIVNVTCLEDVPENSPADRESYIKLSLINELVLPMSAEGEKVGAFTLAIDKEDFFWPETLVKQLILTGNIIATAIHRRKNEEKNRKLREELLQVTRWFTMGELSASVTHELNQPLCSILTNAETGLRFISSSKVDINEIRNILEDIVFAAHRADSVIKSLKSMFKKEEKKFKILNLNEIIKTSFNLVKGNTAIRGIKTSLKLLPDELTISGDEVKLQQVIINLILNGVDAMAVSEKKEILIGTEMDKDNITVFVRDRGEGIKEKDKIFLPFYTTKPEGMGMGLSITKTIIEEHQGKLWAENNPDGGSTFYFTIPAVKEKKEGTLLYFIDDDVMIRKSIERFLKSEGYRVKSFNSGEDFLKEEFYEESSCLILDVSLPSLSGLELQEKLKELNIDLPIIFISGQNNTSDSVQAIKNGALDFLCKPFKNKELLKAVRRAINANISSLEEK